MAPSHPRVSDRVLTSAPDTPQPLRHHPSPTNPFRHPSAPKPPAGRKPPTMSAHSASPASPSPTLAAVGWTLLILLPLPSPPHLLLLPAPTSTNPRSTTPHSFHTGSRGALRQLRPRLTYLGHCSLNRSRQRWETAHSSSSSTSTERSWQESAAAQSRAPSTRRHGPGCMHSCATSLHALASWCGAAHDPTMWR